MRAPLFVLSLVILTRAPFPAVAAGPDDSVVKVIASVRYPNPIRPWTKSNPVEVFGTGVMIEGKKILTNAHLVLYATEVYVQHRNGGDKIEAKVEAVGPDVDLAVVTPKEGALFEKTPPVNRSKKVPKVQDSVVVYGFPVGGNDLSVGGGRYTGKPMETAGTRFQSLENAALRRMLKLEKNVTGVLVCPREHPTPDYPLKPFDVLIKVGEHEIDNEGMVRHENGFRIPFLCLVPQLASGSAVPVTVLRDGRRLPVSLPVTTHDDRLIRDFQGEQPSYFIHGPLVFSPVKGNPISLYARLNPGLFAAKSPLLTRHFDRVRFSGEELVVVTAPMFAHKIAKGYGNPIGCVLQEVNGVPIKNLRHLVETLRDCTDEYLVFRFADERSEVLVFDRREMDKVTAEILEENGIAPSRRGSADMIKAWQEKDLSSR
jgi:hypothetical protein